MFYRLLASITIPLLGVLGYYKHKNKRKTVNDFSCTVTEVINDTEVTAVIMCDGDVGTYVSSCLKEILPTLLRQKFDLKQTNPSLKTIVREAQNMVLARLVNMFPEMQRDIDIKLSIWFIIME